VEGCEVCPACGGEWLEAAALGARLEHPEAPPAPARPAPHRCWRPSGRRWRRCPVCRAVLTLRPWHGALTSQGLETCPLGHGVWATPAEMQALHDATQRARLTLHGRAAYFRFLARSAARHFERASRPRRERRVSFLARLLGPWL